MDKYFVFTDCDLDGAGSYLMLKWLMGTTPLPYKGTTVKNFGEDFSKWLTTNTISNYKKIFILDMCVAKYADLVDHPNVVIIDHHKNHSPSVYKHASKILKETTSNVELMRTTLLKGYNFTPEQAKLVDIIDDYDCYKLSIPQSIMLNTLFWQYKNDRIKQFMIEFENGFVPFNVTQKNIILLQLKKIQDYIQNTPIYFSKNTGYTVASMFGEFAINELADYIMKKTKCDIACIVNPKLKRLYFRRCKTSSINLPDSVETLTGVKGEGHENACGAPLTEQFIEYTKQFTVYEKN